ncbi:MAG: DNA repair protein RecN [Gammaproteobacteria bacterium]|nr:DNA repair protein RecN [Gammaproteobacteria bacterium]
MLTQLHIRNLAVIDAAELEFGDGLTVLTGETGAGKSIMVDALALALGARADSKAIRAGADRCEVTVGFEFAGASPLCEWLEARDLAAGDECLVRRVITSEGRSRGYVNGQPVTMQTLQELGELLLDICGQQDHQRLRHRAVQRKLLDRFGDHDAELRAMAEAHAAWRAARDERDRLLAAGEDLAARHELLSFQVRELEALNLAADEYPELEREERRLAHGSRIESGLRTALDAIYEADEGSAHGAIGRNRQALEDLLELDQDLEPIARLLAESEVLLSEAADGLRDSLQRNEHDPAREQTVAERVASARSLARKHRCEPAELPDLARRLAVDLEEIDARDDRLAQAETELAQRRTMLETCATRLSNARRTAGGRLADAVTANMQQLGMSGGRFLVELPSNKAAEIAAWGAESVEFQVAVNPGQPPGPLARVASGGELSRISLALQVVTLGDDPGGTLIFDEVDAGVGGGVAEIVGMQLQSLSRNGQVLCVTHLAQVASHADQHLKVTKLTDGQTTRTAVKALAKDERVEEIARMLGGVEITSRTRDHAREILDLAAAKRSA